MSNPKTTIPEKSPEPEEEEKIDPNAAEKERRNGDEDEVLMEIPTYNFTLLFCTMMAGIGLGYIIWVFVKKELIIWLGAAVGLLVGRLLEITVFPQNVVTIWTTKNTIEMTQAPHWNETIQQECDFFVQSDMYDLEKRYVRTTAVYHYPNTNAITVHERFVGRRSGFKGQLFMNSPIGGAASVILGLAASAIWYLRNQNISEQISLFIIAFVVIFPVIVLLGCLIEVELRKRRFLSYNLASETVTNIPLHTVGQVERITYGGDFWKLLYVPPEARNNWSRAKLTLKLIFGPVLFLYRIGILVIALTMYNGALALFLWEWLATMLVYQAHVNKDTSYLEPAMAILWLTVLINIFELWYCWTANGRMDSLTLLGTNPIRKLELDSATRIPKEKVKKLFCGFIVSLVLLVLASILITAVSDNVLQDIVIYNFDKSWKNNYKENEKFIMCKADGDESGSSNTTITNSTRRLVGELQPRTAIKTKYASDYDALCSNRVKYALTGAVVFCSLDWVLLLLMAVYWTINDKYQSESTYDNSQMVWHEVSGFSITFVPSKITWLGRVLGRQIEKTFHFYIRPAEAEQLGLFLINNVPWYSQLDPRTPLSKELLPRHTDVDTDDQVPRGVLAAWLSD